MFDDLVIPGRAAAGAATPAAAEDGLLTLDRLWALAASWSPGLDAAGIGAGAVVTVELDEPADVMAAVLALWHRGARALPFYRGWWPRERSGVLDLAAPDLRLRAAPASVGGGAAGPLPGPDPAVMVAGAAELWAATPGATGEPAVFRFDAAQLRRSWLAPLPGLTATTVHVTIDPAHPPTLRFVLGALAGGCRVRFAGGGPAGLERTLRRWPGVLWCTPPTLRRVLRRVLGPAGTIADAPLPVAAVVVGSPLRRRDRRDAAHALAGPARSLLTVTEAGGWPGGHVAVIGPDGIPAGPGGSGRLAVGGPDAARARVGGLRPDPLGWPTGDLAHQRSEGGGVHVVGRAHDAWWHAGRLAHPHPAEEALADHPGVADVAVVERRGPDGVTPVAVVVPVDDTRPPFLVDLAAELAGLDRAERPTAQWIVERLPQNVAGVVDRRRLRYEESSR